MRTSRDCAHSGDLGGFKRRVDRLIFFDMFNFFDMKVVVFNKNSTLKANDQYGGIITRAVAFWGYMNCEPKGGRYR